MTANPDIELRWRGVHKAKDYADEVQADWQRGIEAGAGADWRLDEHYLVKKGQWTVVTGIPSHGKSTWLDNLLVRLANKHGWKFLICSPENQPIQRHIESLVEIHSGKKFENPDKEERFKGRCISIEELAKSTLFVNEHFRFICPDETDFNIDYILELAREVKNDQDDLFNFDGLVLDPYNELEHKRPNQMSETEYISFILSKFRRFARSEDVHGWIVAHPTKLKELQAPSDNPKQLKVYSMPSLYDIAGAAHWRNKADMGVVVYRNIGNRPETTTVSVQKVRFRECGSLGSMDFHYDFLCNRYVDDENDMLFHRVHE